jgi:hypothetical protein
MPPRRTGFLALPYLGVESHRGNTGNDEGPGLVLGTFLGGRLNPMFSLNGELTIDVLNPKNVPSGEDVSAAEVDIAFSPLVHLPAGPLVELVMGPKLGIFASAEQDSVNGDTFKARANGWVAGLNLGAFAAIGPSVSLGGMLNAQLRKPVQECSTLPGESEICDSTSSFTAEKVIAVYAGALF